MASSRNLCLMNHESDETVFTLTRREMERCPWRWSFMKASLAGSSPSCHFARGSSCKCPVMSGERPREHLLDTDPSTRWPLYWIRLFNPMKSNTTALSENLPLRALNVQLMMRRLMFISEVEDILHNYVKFRGVSSLLSSLLTYTRRAKY